MGYLRVCENISSNLLHWDVSIPHNGWATCGCARILHLYCLYWDVMVTHNGWAAYGQARTFHLYCTDSSCYWCISCRLVYTGRTGTRYWHWTPWFTKDQTQTQASVSAYRICFMFWLCTSSRISFRVFFTYCVLFLIVLLVRDLYSLSIRILSHICSYIWQVSS